MKKFKIAILFGFFATTLSILFSNCSDSFAPISMSGSSGASSLNLNLAQSNVIAVTTGCGYVNEPCVTVTICQPGTNTCQTIPNVLLDTGSYGLRLFNQVSLDNFQTVSNLLSLTTEKDPNNPANSITECVSYADSSSDVGPVARADVSLGSETASSVPIQIINSSFAQMGSPCDSPDASPLATGFNGILGVGLFTADCGDGCTASQSNPQNGMYFSCVGDGSSCTTGMTVELNQQVTNPVAYLPVDNNGVILALPSVPDAGAGSVNGYLVFGIGTQSNNIPLGANIFQADGYGNFLTTYNGVTSTQSFIDSGSNALYFNDSSITQCATDTGFYCPASEISGLVATQQGVSGGTALAVGFNVANGESELAQSNPNMTFSNLAGTFGSADFDWGLPFFYGRTVFVGMDTGTSSLGAGPLWAF